MGKKYFSDEQIQDIIKLYIVDKKSLKSIGQIYGCSGMPISRILKEQNIKIRTRKTYKIGDEIGIYHHKIVRIFSKNNKKWAEFECGWCHNPNTHFENRIDHITSSKNPKISCGCQDIKIKQERAERLRNIAKNNAGKPRLKTQVIHPGDILGPQKNILFIKEIQPRQYGGKTKERKRAGIFKNLDTNKIFESTITNVQSGFCSGDDVSKGEALIEKILKQNNIKYITQKTFSNLVGVGGGKLRYDFYLPDYNCCIEYDGLGHYYFNEKSEWWTENAVKQTQQHDEIKNQYCRDNNIKLIRIPYTDYERLSWDYLKQKLGI